MAASPRPRAAAASAAGSRPAVPYFASLTEWRWTVRATSLSPTRRTAASSGTGIRTRNRRWPVPCSDSSIWSTTASTIRPRPRSRGRMESRSIPAAATTASTSPIPATAACSDGPTPRRSSTAARPISLSDSPTRDRSHAMTVSPAAIPTASARTACAIRRTLRWTVPAICTWPTLTTTACSNT